MNTNFSLYRFGCIAIGLISVLLTALAMSTIFAAPLCAQGSNFPTVTREDVIARAESWLNQNMRYDQRGWNLTDPNSGTRYRQDCSGFVSFAWRGSQRWTTVQLGQNSVSHGIDKDSLRSGDIINNKSSGNAGHVIIFHRWEDENKTEYWGYDFSPSGIQYRKIKYPFNNRPGFEPRRYNNICAEDARYIAQSGYPTVEPGQHFQIWFELENNGTCVWRGDQQYGLVNTNGQGLGAAQSLALNEVVDAGERYRWVIDMVAPNAPGEYVTEWRMTHDDALFGTAPWIRVTVGSQGDNDNRPGDANWLAPAASQTHSLTPAGDEDWFAFGLDNRSSVVLRTAGPSGDTKMWLYDSNHNELVYNDDSANSYFSRIDVDCASGGLPSGRYYAKVAPYNSDQVLPEYNIYLLLQVCSDNNDAPPQGSSAPSPPPVARIRYRVDPGSPACGGIITLEMSGSADQQRVEFNVAKCDFSPIQKTGYFYLVADNGQRYGPVNYSAGDIVISGSFDPLNDLGLTGEHRYEVQLYPDGQDYPIVSGSHRVWAVEE